MSLKIKPIYVAVLSLGIIFLIIIFRLRDFVTQNEENTITSLNTTNAVIETVGRAQKKPSVIGKFDIDESTNSG